MKDLILCDYNQETIEGILCAKNIHLFDVNFHPGEVTEHAFLCWKRNKVNKHLITLKVNKLVRKYFNRVVYLKSIITRKGHDLYNNSIIKTEALVLNYELDPIDPDWLSLIKQEFDELIKALPDNFSDFCDIKTHLRSYHEKNKQFQEIFQILLDLSLEGRDLNPDIIDSLSKIVAIEPGNYSSSIFFSLNKQSCVINIDQLLINCGAKVSVRDNRKESVAQARLFAYNKTELKKLIRSIPDVERYCFQSEFDLLQAEFITLWQAYRK